MSLPKKGQQPELQTIACLDPPDFNPNRFGPTLCPSVSVKTNDSSDGAETHSPLELFHPTGV
jgi:hypothetical protein